MGSRGPSAQYAYGITVELNKDYQKELKALSDGLENLDKKIKATQKSFDSGIQNKGNKGFEQVQKQTADIVESVDRLLQLERELGGVSAPKIFDGLKQNKDDIAKLSGSIKDIRENFTSLKDTVESLPSDLFSRLSDLFVYDEKGATDKLKGTADSIKSIIKEISESTDKDKLGKLMGQLTQMVSEFQIGLTQATNKGWDVSSRALAQTLTDLKGMMPQLSEAGEGFDGLAAKIVGFYNTIGQQYKSKHPTGKSFFKDITVDATKTQASVEQTANKIVASFNAAINVVNKFKNSDMGIAKKGKEMEDFLAKLKNPEITIDLKNKDIVKEFSNLGDEFDKIVGWNDVDIDFLQNLPIDKLQNLGDVLQNIIAIGRKYSGSLSKDLGINSSAFKEEISTYGSNLDKVVTELENRLNNTKESVQQLSNQLQEMLEKAGLKEIELKLGVPADSEIDAYVEKINGFIDKIIKQATRIKKIPMSIAFDDGKQEDEGEKTDPSAKLKEQLESLKKSVHAARTSIEGDAREIKTQLMNMLKLDNKDISNITSAMEALFNEQPLKLYVDGEFLIGEIEKVLNSKTFNISANISGATYSGGTIPVSGGGAPTSNTSAAETQSSAANTQAGAAEDQSKAASENLGAADTQSDAAKDQKAASTENSKSAVLMSKTVAQLTAFAKSFGETYYKALSKQKAMNDKIAKGEEVNDRTVKMTNGKVAKLSPMANYLQNIFGEDTDLSKMTEEYVRNVLTGLLQKNTKTGGFKGELLGSDLSDLSGKWKGSYKNQTALLFPLLGKSGTLESLFKSLGLSTISGNEKINRDYNAPEMLKFYQKYARVADVIDALKGEKGDTKQLLSELGSFLKDLQSTTSSEEYKTNIDEIGKSINTLYSNINEYNKQVIATKGLSKGESNEYTALLNMFKQFYGTASTDTKTLLNSMVGVNPSEEIIHGDALRTAIDAMSKISGDDASSKIANDIVSWLNRMVAGDNVVVSRQTLLGQLGKGEKGAGLKIAGAKNGKGKMTAYGIANNMLSDLNADIYYEGIDRPTVIDRSDSPTSKRKALRMISNLLNNKAKLGTKTQFYSKDNKRPAPFDASQIKVNDEYSINWEERLSAAEESIQKSSEQLAEAKKARDEKLAQLAKQEEEIDQKLQVARDGIASAQSVLDSVKPSSYSVSSEMESLKSDYKQQKDIYDLMVKYQSKTPNKSALKFEGKDLSDDYIQLLEAKKQVESRLATTVNTSKQYKKYEESPDLLSKAISTEQKKQEAIDKEIKEIESKISAAKESENKGLLSKYQIELADKQNELEQSKSRLVNYIKVQKGEKVSSEFESKAKEQETTLQEINRQIQQSVIEQKQKLDDNLFEQLQTIIEEYKQRQQNLSSLEKSLKGEKAGTVEYDKIAAQIRTAKESLNGLFESITNISNDLGLNDIDLKDLFAGMDKQSFDNSKNARDSLKQQIDALQQFKNSKNFDLSNLEIFPKELQTLLQQRAELFNEKSNYDNAKAELKDYKQRLKEANDKGSTEIQAILQRKVDALREYVDNARPKKEINADISNLNSVINNYISSIIQQYGTYIKNTKISLQKYEIGDNVVDKYTNAIASQRSSLTPLAEQKKSIELERESLDNQVQKAEQELKIAERNKQVAQLQIEYNQKKSEELGLVREINKLEESGASPVVLGEKTQALKVINTEVTELYNKLKEINGINSSNIFDESLSPEQKKFNALEKIQELQQVIIRNNEQIGKLGDYTKDVQKAQKLTFNKEQGAFTTIYGNKSSAADNLQKMFVSNYTSTDEFRTYRASLYAKAQEKVDELQNAIANRISEVINNMYQDVASNFVKSKYDEAGVTLHQAAWDTAQATMEQEVQEAIESRFRKINNAENAAIEEILKNEDLSTDELISEISRVRGIFDVKRASLNNGEEIKNIINKKTQKFFDVYYDNFAKLLVENFGEDSVDDQLKGILQSKLSGMTMTKGAGKDQVETAFGKQVSAVFNQAEEKEKIIRKRIYDSVNKKLGESISAYMSTISEDVTRLEGETAEDKVFTDGKGFRVNLADMYRKKNAYFLGIKEALEREVRDAELSIEQQKAYGGISKEEIANITEARNRAYAKLYGGSDSDIQNLDILIGEVDSTSIAETVKAGAEQVVKKTSEVAKKAIEKGIESITTGSESAAAGLKDISEMSKKEQEARLSALEKLANDKLAALKQASTNTAKSRQLSGYEENRATDVAELNNVKTFQQFKTAILALTNAIDNGRDVSKQNVEYGFTEKDGKAIEFVVGKAFEVTFDKIEQEIDSMTHSHVYKKGTNNLMFSLSDIEQLADFADENNLKKYNMIYGRQMMSIDLGKDSFGTALDIAEKYPIINDVITAMFSTANGEDIAAQNSGEMARMLNGYLQRVVKEAGGMLSISDISTGQDVGKQYSITDEEYSKLSNVIANFQSYYDRVLNSDTNVSKQDYVGVIRGLLSKEFGGDFISQIVNREYDKSMGGITTEYSALPDQLTQAMRTLFATLESKKLTSYERGFYDEYKGLSADEIAAEMSKLKEALGIGAKEIEETTKEVKSTLTKAQMDALNPDSTSAWTKRSIKDAGKALSWNDKNYADIQKVLGTDNTEVQEYANKFKELQQIAADIRAKGENGTVITDADLQKLDSAVSKVKELQTELTKNAKIQSAYQALDKEGRIISGDNKISENMLFTDRQAIMEAYAKQYATSKNSQYDFSQYDFVKDKISFDMVDADGKITSVIMSWSDAFNSAYIQSEKLQDSCDNVTASIHKINQAIVDGQKEGFFDKNSKEMQAYQEAMNAYGTAQEAVRNSTADNLDENINKLKAAQEELVKLGNGIIGKSKDAYGYNSATKVLGREEYVKQALSSYNDQSVNVNDLTIVKEYFNALDALKKKKDELAQSGKLLSDSDGEQAALKLLADRATEAEKALLGADEAQRKINSSQLTGEKAKFFEGVNPADIDAVKNAMLSYVNSVEGASFKGFNAETRTMTYEMKIGKNEVQEMTIVMGELGNAVEIIPGKIKPVETGLQSFINGIKGKFKEVGTYLASFGSIYRIWGAIKQGVQYVQDIDAALTELKKVTDETDETYAKFLKTMAQTGANVGATTSDLTNMAASWARLGYSIEEAGELAKSTAVLLNVSEFTDADKASEALISTIQAFGYAAKDSMHVVDVLNEIGNNFAVSSDGIATALQDSASSLMAAGNSLEQSVALIAAANKVVQDPNSVGSALRTISLRIRGTSVKELEEMGEETDGVVESVSKLQSKVKGLSGVNILTDTGAYKDTYTIIKEIAQVWDQMNDIDRAALLELLAGKNRSNAMAAMLTNIEDLEGAYQDALDAEGSAMAENEKQLNSIQGRITLFKNAVQTMWSDALDSSWIKFFVNLGTEVVKAVDAFGLFKSALVGVVSYLLISKKINPVTMFKELSANISNYGQALEKIKAIQSVNGLGETGKISTAEFNAQNISAYAAAVSDLTAKQQAAALASAGLTKAQIEEAMAKNGVDQANIKQAVSEAQVTTEKTKQTTVTAANAAAMAAEGTVKLSAESTNWLLAQGETELTLAKIQGAVATGQLTAAQAAEIISAFGLTAANQGLSTSIHGVAGALKSLMASNPVGWIMLAISLVISLITWIANMTPASEKLKNEIKELDNEIEGLNSELQTTADRIKELEGKHSLSFVEKEELEKLRQTNDELERKLRLLNESKESKQKELQKETKKDYEIDFVNQKTSDDIGSYITNKDSERYGKLKNFQYEYSGANGIINDNLKEAVKQLDENLYNEIKDAKFFDDLSDDTRQKLIELSNEVANEINDNFAFLENSEMSKEDRIQKGIEKYNELKEEWNELINTDTSNMSDSEKEQIDARKKEIETSMGELKTTLASYGTELYQYLDDYGADVDDEFAQKLREQIANIDKTLNPGEYYTEQFDALLEKYPEVKKKLYSLAEAGELTEDALNGADYQNFRNELNQIGLSTQDAVNQINSLGAAAAHAELNRVDPVGSTFSNYSDVLDKVTDAQSVQDEVVYDKIKLTEEQGEVLKTLIGDEKEYADAIDTTNGYVVKSAEVLNRLITKKRQEAAQNVKTERSQARLKYYELYKKIKQLTGANGELAQANAKEINALYKEMGAVERTIAKYSLLEQKLLGAADAYQKYEDAKSADEAKDYGSKAEDMISGLIEGLQSAKLGTESFKAAVAGMIPEDVYSGFDTVEEKVAAIANYLKNSDFSKYFTLKFSDDGTLESAEMTLDNVQAFIESAQEKGVFTNKGDWQHFELSSDIKTLDDFCDKMKITKEMAFAMFTEIDSYDAEWLNGDFGSVFDQLDLGLEGNIFMATKNLAELDVALANNEIGVEEWAQKYQEASGKLQGCAEKARKNAVDYQNATQEVTKLKGELEQATEKLNEMNKPNSGYTQEQIDEQTKKVKGLTEQLGEALKNKYNLEEPTEVSIQLALDDIDSQMAAWKANNNELAVKAKIDNIDDSELVELGEDGKYQIKPNVEITDDERQKLQQYVDLLNDKGVINLLVDNKDEAKAQIEEVKTAAEAAKKAIEALPDPSVDSTAAVKSINKLIDAINLIPTGVTVTTTYREVSEGQTVIKPKDRDRSSGGHNGNIMLTQLNGTAHASGNWGAESTDTSLVGELGPELRVRGNRWDMLGENGAEFADVKKGDIIFNHKQTKSLLKNGYINSRGKAYASGTNVISNIFDKLKLNKLAKYAEEMCKQYEELVNGNVDLRKRPHLSPSYEHDLAMGGGYNSFIGSDGEIYASTSAETVTIGDKNKYTIDITPVLENGDVLTSDALADYIDSLVTNGSTQDLLNSDKYNLVIRAVPGEYDEKDWAGFEGELSKYKDGYLNTIMEMFNIGGEKAVESSGFSSVGLAGVTKDLQDNGSYTGKEVASAIDDTSDGMRELDNLINQYVTDVLNAKSLADDIGTDLSQTKYGNVDTNDRQKLYWDEESLDKYGDAIDSWGMKADDLAGTYSTLLSSVGEFDGEDIAFTPILQTENGPQLLDSNTVDKYIWGLIDEAKQNDGKWTSDELFQLDTKGLEVDGVVVKNLLEGIGQDADKTAKLLHYVGDTGAISNLEGEIESTSSELVATGENVSAVQAKLDKLNATSISDKTFTITTAYQIIGKGTEQTVHTPGASGRLTIYADGTAHASGNWGLPQAEDDALVGELGRETVVDPKTGKYYTVGDNGAEFVDLPKNAIIFNHKQTEELFKNGHINSRGKAYSEGNAHVTIVPDYTTPTYYSGAKNDNFWTDWSDAADSLSDAGDDLSDAANDFEEMFDWFAVLLEEIDDDLNYMSAALENAVGISAKNDIQEQMINVNKFKLTELGEGYKLYADYAAELLGKVPEQYRDLAEKGGVALTHFLGEANQEVVEAINNYREWAQKASDVRTQQQQVKKEITSISLEKVQTIADEYDRVITKITTLNDLLQANVDLIEEQGERTSAVMYEEMIKNSSKELDELQKKRDAMQKEFDAQVSAGNIDVGSEEWYEGISAIQDVDKSIIDCRKDIEGFQNSINQLHWDNFDGLIEAIDNVGNEISNLGDLIDDEDIADEMGNWTDKGITKMGLLAQEMERAQYRAKQYAEQIEYLNQEYAAGKYSTDEYNEKLQELKDGQWDSIKSYEAAKDALVDLNKTRVDAAKNAMQKEIDAYNELINKKKEELQLSKDAHDFSKQVAEQQKNIASIQKQLAAIAGDNSASAIARRKKLEAELTSAQEELDELYYNHSIEKQQDALDDQAESYQDEKEKEMEALDEYLKNVEQVIADSFATITGNTEAVAETLRGIADEYGINLSEAITNPWEQGVIAIGTYQDQLDTSMSAFTAQLDAIKKQLLDLQAEADNTARHLIDATNQKANKTSSATYTPPTPSTPSQPSAPQKPAAPSNGSSVTVKKSATNFTRDGGNGTRMQSWVPGSTFTVYQVSGSEVLIGRNGQYTGWVRLSDLEGYAKGIKKVPNNQLAITDELGLEELVLHAGDNGRLQYLSKGSSVIPADITDNLMKLGSLDPKDVLDRNRPKIGAPYIVNNSIELNMSFGNMINIEHADKDSIPEIKDVVKAQLDSYMKNINSSLKKYTR